MADITFHDATAPNPPLEFILDSGGQLKAIDAATFQIINDTGGIVSGYIVEFSGTGFSYSVNDEPTAGTITGVTFYLPDGTTAMATITGAFGDASLAGFWGTLKGTGFPTLALDQLLSGDDTYTGSTGADVLTQYDDGPTTEVLSGGGGNDDILGRWGGTFVGGTGDDKLWITGVGTYTIAGSGLNGSGGAGETNTLVVAGTGVVSGITDIDAVEFFGFGISALYLDISEIGPGLASDTMSVDGATGGENTLWIAQVTPGAATVDLSGWTFTNWNRIEQQVVVSTFDGNFADDIVGTVKNDAIETWGGNDTIDGGAGNDFLRGGDGADILRGGAGDDYLSADIDDTEIDGGADTDLLNVDLRNLSQPITIDSSAGTGVLADATVFFTGIEGLTVFYSGDFDDVIDAGIGDGKIFGGGGGDVIDGGIGSDELNGEAGSDQLFSRLGEGPDGGKTERLDGGAGTDFAFVDRSDQQRSFAFELIDPGIETTLGDGTIIINVERIEFRSGSGNDNLAGGDLDDTILGNGGRDLISGRGGNDDLQGGGGLDIIDGGSGNDDIAGGAGIDILSGDGGNDSIDGGDDADIIDGGAGNDDLSGGGNADNLGGGAGNDTLAGDGGADTIDGGSGNDTIDGGSGKDTIDGGKGNDTINGGKGRDSVSGGSGNDIFVLDQKLKKSNRDTIEDFDVGDDTIHLDNAIFKKLSNGALKAKFFEKGSEADDKKDRVIHDKKTGELFYDKDGKGGTDQVKIAELDDGLKITEANFFVI
ncbi:hypothetical protein [Bauldia sp.]|uniref:hypothetical protein n=1 Tax=Bauldia sp. TaxID=2575872 RepID=UPI003BAB973C